MTPILKRELRRALGKFPTGVAIITSRDPLGKPFGLTVNSFTSVSLDPPLILWCLRRESKSLERFKRCEFFAAHVLATDQAGLSSQFAKGLAEPFEGLSPTIGLGGVPLLEGVCARLECQNAQQIDGGDHIIFVGQVERFKIQDRNPLLYYQGAYCDLVREDQQGGEDIYPAHLCGQSSFPSIGLPWG